MEHLDGGGQAHKLAAAVYAYATHIDRLDELATAVDHISHRHVATRILPEKYPLIGEKLLQAMKDVLQCGLNSKILAARSKQLVSDEASINKVDWFDFYSGHSSISSWSSATA